MKTNCAVNSMREHVIWALILGYRIKTVIKIVWLCGSLKDPTSNRGFTYPKKKKNSEGRRNCHFSDI